MMETNLKIDRSEPIKETLRSKGAIFLDNYVANDKTNRDIVYQRWLCKGYIIVLEINISIGGYQMFKPANESMKIEDDINFIKNL